MCIHVQTESPSVGSTDASYSRSFGEETSWLIFFMACQMVCKYQDEISWYLPDGLGQTIKNISQDVSSPRPLSSTSFQCITFYKSYCSTVHFRRITSVYQPTNARIISYKTLLKHFKTHRHVSILSDHHQGALFLAKVILQYSQFNSYLQTSCCGSISWCVGRYCGSVARCASYPCGIRMQAEALVPQPAYGYHTNPAKLQRNTNTHRTRAIQPVK